MADLVSSVPDDARLAALTVTGPGAAAPDGTPAGARPVVTVSADEGFLADPETVYPAVIDPTYEWELGYPAQDTFIENTGTYYGGGAGAGLTRMRSGTSDSGGHRARSYIKFHPLDLAGLQLQGANLRVRMTRSLSCTGAATNVHRIISPWQSGSLSWGALPVLDYAWVHVYSPPHGGPAGTRCAAHEWAVWNVLPHVQAWQAGAPQEGFQLSADSPFSNSNYREFRQMENILLDPTWVPKLRLWYNHYPNQPPQPTTTGAPYGSSFYTDSTTPTFTTTVSDDDGGTVTAVFQVFDAAGTEVASCWSPRVASGEQASCAVSALPEGGSYTVRAMASDDGLFGPGSALLAFTVASQTPVAPTIACPAPYADGSWHDAAPAEDVTCTVSAPGSGASAPGWITTLVDGVERTVQIPQSADPAVARTSVVIPKTEGGHFVEAWALSPSGTRSEPALHSVGWGAVGMARPAAGSPVTTTDRISIEVLGPVANGASGDPGVSVKWRVAGTDGTFEQGWNTTTLEEEQGLSVTNTVEDGVKVTGTWDTRTAVKDSTSVAAGQDPIDVPVSRPVLLEIQVCINYPGAEMPQHCTWSAGQNRVLRVPHAFGGNYPVTEVPGGQVALWTGELAAAGTEATVTAPAASLSVSRSHASFAGPATNPAAGVFGPGWRAGLEGPEAGLGAFTLVDNTVVDGTLMLDDGLGLPMVFGHEAVPDRREEANLAQGQWVGLDEDTELSGATLRVEGTGTATKVIVTEADGTATTYSPQTAPAATAAGATAGTFVVDKVAEPAAEGETTFTRDIAGRVTRMLAPSPAGVGCPGVGDLPAGCRALEIDYATSTTATTGSAGDVAGQVTALVQVVGRDMVDGGELRTTLATYKYDEAKRLVSVTDPRNSLTTRYAYDSEGRLATVTPPGLEPVTYLYGTGGKLARVQRPRPTGDAEGGTATLASLVYDVPVKNAEGLPSLDAANVGVWGQTPTPTYAAAVFGADASLGGTSVDSADVAASAWRDAQVSYTDADGRILNTATYGAGAWQFTSATYDHNGNVVKSLDAGEIAAIKAEKLVASQAGTETIYNTDEKDAAGKVILPAGSVPVETFGTGRWILTKDGTQKWVRPHTKTDLDHKTDLDQKPPGDDRVNPKTGQAYALPTTVTTDAVELGEGGAWEAVETYSVVRTDYSSAVEGNVEAGWAMGLPGTVTSDMGGSGADIVARSRYDAAGRLVETRQPKSNGSDAGTRQTIYYTAGDNAATSDCGGNKAWAGLECRIRHAGAPSSGPGLTTTTVTGYNTDLQVLTSTETSGEATRTTTNTYFADGRLKSTATNMTGGSGSTPVGEVTFAYDEATGLPRSQTTAAAGGNPGGTITNGHDGWGRQVTYSPAAGEVTTTRFDPAGRVASIEDPKGTVTYAYDGTDAAGKVERRGLPTKLTVTRAGGAAPLEFSGAYDADGGLVTQKLPGGVTQRFSYDAAGEPVGQSYSGQVTEFDPETGAQTGTNPDGAWLGWSQHNDALGRVRREWTPNGAAFSGKLTGAAATGFSRDYTYDRAARLVEVKDRTSTPGQEIATDADGNPVGTPAPACQTRVYGFDANGNRTSLTRRDGNSDGTCATAGGITTGWTYDTADRLVSGGNGQGSYAYDPLGRATTMPAADTPNALAAGGSAGIGAIGLGYYDTDAIRTLSQEGTTTSYGLDAAGRRSTEETGPTGGAPVSSVTRHYTDGTDNPGWIETTKNGANTIARFVEGLTGDLAAEIDGNGLAKLDLANLHGDISASVTLPASGPATGIDGWTDADEYGNPRTGSTAGVGGQLGYSWLGAKQRAHAGDTGLMLMGARVYNPTTGQFTSEDPVYGGNTTAYGYPQDPINFSDVTGLMAYPGCGAAGQCDQMMRACRNHAGVLVCVKLFRNLDWLRNYSTSHGLNDNEHNAGRHFAFAVFTALVIGIEGARDVLNAHEPQGATRDYALWDGRRDGLNNAYSLGWLRRHRSFANRLWRGTDHQALAVFFWHGYSLFERGYLHGICRNRQGRYVRLSSGRC